MDWEYVDTRGIADPGHSITPCLLLVRVVKDGSELGFQRGFPPVVAVTGFEELVYRQSQSVLKLEKRWEENVSKIDGFEIGFRNLDDSFTFIPLRFSHVFLS